MKNRVLALVVFAFLLQSCGVQPKPVAPSTERRVIGYYVDWGVYDRGHHVRMIDASKLTHINYAFAVIGPDFTIQLLDPNADVQKIYGDEPAGLDFHGNLAALVQLKASHPGLKTMISVGGWTKSSNFSAAASSDEHRRAFAASVLAFVDHYRMDGVDLDWEYPVEGGLATNGRSPDDKANYTKLVKEIRWAFEQAETKDGKHREISLAVTANPGAMKNMEVSELGLYLDFMNVMAYDFYVPPTPQTHHQAGLKPNPVDPDVAGGKPEGRYNAEAAVDEYLQRGFPAAKLVLGIPFYGRGWLVEPGTARPLFAPALDKLPRGTWEPGNFDYDDLVSKRRASEPGMTQWDEAAQASYYYDPQEGLFVSYDDVRSVENKAQWLVDKGLGGAMFWELSEDRMGALMTPLARIILGR